MKITAQNYGSQFILTVRAKTPDEVSRKIFQFAAYGMFLPDALPTEYDEKRHSMVTFAVTKARVLPALEALALDRFTTAKRSKRFKGQPQKFMSVIKAQARADFAAFEIIGEEKVDDDAPDLRSYKVPDEDRSPEFDKARARFRGSLDTRNDAKRAAKLSEE